MPPPKPSAPPAQSNTIMDIKINNLNEYEIRELMYVCMSKNAVEIRLLSGYCFFDKIQKGDIKFTDIQRFNAILNSPYLGYINVSSDNIFEVMRDLEFNGPASFIELDEIVV